LRSLSLIILVLTLGSSPIYSQQPPTPNPVDETQMRLNLPEETNQAPVTTDLSIWDFLRMIFVLAVLVGLIWGFVYLMKRFTQRPNSELDGVRLLATFNLSPTRVLYFVEVGEKVLLLSGAENGVNHLMQIDDQVLIDHLRLKAAQVKPPSQPFWDIFKKMFGSNQPPFGTPPSQSSTEFLQKQRERLKNLSTKP